jgi:trigger factor
MEGTDLNSIESKGSNETATEKTATETAGDGQIAAGVVEGHEHEHEHSHEHEHEHSHEHEHEHDEEQGPSLNPLLTREVAVEAPAEEVAKAFRTVIKRYQKLARIPGFRAGKVPESLVRTKFARELREEVLQSLVSERFRQAIVEQKLQPVSEPQLLDLQLTDGQPLRFKAMWRDMRRCGWRSRRPS